MNRSVNFTISCVLVKSGCEAHRFDSANKKPCVVACL